MLCLCFLVLFAQPAWLPGMGFGSLVDKSLGEGAITVCVVQLNPFLSLTVAYTLFSQNPDLVLFNFFN